jgi:hypothetical protein
MRGPDPACFPTGEEAPHTTARLAGQCGLLRGVFQS